MNKIILSFILEFTVKNSNKYLTQSHKMGYNQLQRELETGANSYQKLQSPHPE